MSSNFFYDIPSSVYHHLMNSTNNGGMSFSILQYNLLFSIYAFPNIILPFVSGILIDKIFGLNFGIIFFSWILFFSGIVFLISYLLKSTTLYFAQILMICSRFIFGLGGESLCAINDAFLDKWFSGMEISFAFGLIISFQRIASAGSDLL